MSHAIFYFAPENSPIPPPGNMRPPWDGTMPLASAPFSYFPVGASMAGQSSCLESGRRKGKKLRGSSNSDGGKAGRGACPTQYESPFEFFAQSFVGAVGCALGDLGKKYRTGIVDCFSMRGKGKDGPNCKGDHPFIRPVLFFREILAKRILFGF